MAQKILATRPLASQFLKRIDGLLPEGVAPHSLRIEETGRVTLTLSQVSLSEIDKLNENLRKAVEEGRISKTEIKGLSKEEESSSLYKLTLSFQLLKRNGD